MDTIKKITRKGAGRTKGSFSFSPLTVKQVVEQFGSMPNLKLLISRKQLEAFGLEHLVTGSAVDLTESISGQAEETQGKITKVDLD
jgi:hypothetical protein